MKIGKADLLDEPIQDPKERYFEGEFVITLTWKQERESGTMLTGLDPEELVNMDIPSIVKAYLTDPSEEEFKYDMAPWTALEYMNPEIDIHADMREVE